MILDKKDKKIARQAMDIGLIREFESGLADFEKILKEWRESKLESGDAYHTLYGAVRDFDKHIARRYDGVTGSHYFDLVGQQLREKWISDDDLIGISDEFRENLENYLSMFS